ELAVDRVRQMMREEVFVENVAADRAVAIAAASADHDDAVAGAAVRGLEREFVVAAHDVRQRADVVLGLDHSVELRNRDARGDGESLGLELVVDQWIPAARIEAQDVVAIALVEAEDALTLQTAVGADHQVSLPVGVPEGRSALKRRNSSR